MCTQIKLSAGRVFYAAKLTLSSTSSSEKAEVRRILSLRDTAALIYKEPESYILLSLEDFELLRNGLQTDIDKGLRRLDAGS